MGKKENMTVEVEKGTIGIIVKTMKDNEEVLVTAEIKLMEEGEELREEVKRLRSDMEELKKRVGWVEPVVKEI